MLQATVDGDFGIENVHWGQGVAPVPGEEQVLVRMRAASLNFRDLLVATGKYNPKMPLPRVLLSDGAGEVAALGSGVTRWRVGDRVAGIFMQTWLAGRIGEESGKSALGGAIDGVLAEEVVVDQNGLVAIPAHLSFEEAATLPCAAVTAWNALVWSGGLRPGETVLVQGSGGVSVFALQFAKMAGARVVAITSTAQKMERLKSLGADWVVNYREDANWGRTIAKAGGVDHVVEVGGTGTLEELLEAMTLKRLGLFLGPIVLVNTQGYYEPLLAQLASAIEGRFMDNRHGGLWSVVAEPEAVLHAIETAPEWSSANRDFAVVR